MHTYEYPRPAYTSDAMVLHLPTMEVLLTRRNIAPFENFWVLPGGHTNPDESSKTSALRELAEETGVILTPDNLLQIGAFDAPGRDPRGWYVSTAYLAMIRKKPEIKLDPVEVKEYMWANLADIIDKRRPELGFDHREIVQAGLVKANEYRSLEVRGII